MHTTAKLETVFSYISEVLDVLRSTNQYEQVLHLTIDRIARTYGCHVCAIVLIDRKTEYLNIENSFGLSWTYCKEFRKKLATGPIGRLLWTGKPIFINDPSIPLATEVQLEHPFSTCIITQIAIDHRTLGYLYAATKGDRLFDSSDVSVIQTFANAAAIAIHKSGLHYDNMHLDKTDPETGLDKYEAFLERMRTSVERADKFDESLSIVLLDVDNYKSLANTYGHDNSIRFLRELSNLVKCQLRPGDIAGRYGFDELVILLPKSTLDDALLFAQQLSTEVKGREFTEHNYRSTISIGVASYPENGTSVDRLLTAAKNALFEAQRAGNNKVFHCDQEWEARDATVQEPDEAEVQ